MRFLAVSIRKDWDRARRDPFSLLTAVGIPLVLAVLITVIFGRDPVTPHGRLLIADEDHSIASGLVTAVFQSRQLASMLTLETTDRGTGRARMDRGEASGLLVIPQGFQQAFLGTQKAQLLLYTNPSQTILPRLIEESLDIVTDASFYFQHGGRYPMSPAPFNSLIRLDTEVVRARPRSVNFAAQFLPSMLFMGLLFTSTSMAGDIWKERISGTLRRLASTPVSIAAFLAARVLFVAMVYALVALVGIGAAHALAHMPAPNLAAAVGWMIFTGTIFYLLFLWVALSAATQRAASVWANLIVFPLAMLGGCFFPFDWMPAWMASIGRLTPNGWAVTQFQAILGDRASAGLVGPSAAALAVCGALAFFFAMRRLRGGFAV